MGAGHSHGTATGQHRNRLEIAVPNDGMKASDMPSAATRDAGSTSTQKEPSGRTNDSQPIPAASTRSPVTIITFGPNRPMAVGASAIMPIMIRTVIGKRAAPLGKAL